MKMLECRNRKLIGKAVTHLRRQDKILAHIIDRIGPFKLTLRLPPFTGTVQTIIAQQLSDAAAASIYSKFARLYPSRRPAPALVAATSLQKLRSAGISSAKATAIKQLASKFLSKEFDVTYVSSMDDDSAICYLTGFKGIGEWTAKIFLLFSLGRMDILPTGDAALRRAMQKEYDLKTFTDYNFSRITNRWKPYRSVACWYLWKSLGIENI